MSAAALQLVDEFKNSKVFWQQFEIGAKIVALHDTNVLSTLAGCLTNEDRHARGNAAFIFARLGDARGFDVLREILTDRSARPKVEGMVNGNWTLQAQIASDRYYAVHLFGDLKDRRAVPILVPLLNDKEVNYIVPWSLGEIGDKRAIEPLIGALSDKNPLMRVLAIDSLQDLRAVEALPHLRALTNDDEKIDFDNLSSVAEAARVAITKLESESKQP